MALQSGGPAPYAPPAAVIEILMRYRDRGLQTPITTDVIERAGVPESLSQRTLQALRLLGFIQKDGNPSEEIERLARLPEDEWRKGMQDLLVATYSEVWSFVDPAKDSIDRIRDAFRMYNPRGQQERMVTLFLGLCEWAGVDVSAAVASKKKAGNGPQERKRPGGSATKMPVVKVSTKNALQKRQSKTSDDPLTNLPPGLVGLLQQIPASEKGWLKGNRDAFLTAFTAVLDFTIPVVDTPDLWAGSDDDEEEANDS